MEAVPPRFLRYVMFRPPGPDSYLSQLSLLHVSRGISRSAERDQGFPIAPDLRRMPLLDL